MPLPRAAEARPYYQAAKQRFEDARFLLGAQRTTGAMYLAGYSVECMLKALVLSSVPAATRPQVLASFRGSKGHDFDWLKRQYFKHGGAQFPSDVMRHFSLVNTWETDLRYYAATARPADAADFIRAVEEMMAWADARL
jgi:HEPN domain-containing protein